MQAAILPRSRAPRRSLTAANVAAGSIETTAILIGPAVAGVVLRPRPGPGLRRSGALAGGAILVAGLPRTIAPGRGAAAGLRAVVVRETVAGFTMLAREERPRSVVVLLGSASVLWGALDVLLVVLALDALSMGQSGVGFLNAAIGAGGIVGAMLAAS